MTAEQWWAVWDTRLAEWLAAEPWLAGCDCSPGLLAQFERWLADAGCRTEAAGVRRALAEWNRR